MNARWLAICTLGMLLVGDSPMGKAADADGKGIKGRWVADQSITCGRKAGKNEETTLVIDGGTVAWTYTKKEGNTATQSTITFTYKLDPTKKPAEIDLMPTSGTFEGKVFSSSYKLDDIDGNTLEICRNQPDLKRPTEFVSKEGTEHRLLILKRVKPN